MEKEYLNFRKYVNNIKKNKMITLCFLNFHVPFRTILSYKLEVTPFLLSEDECIYLDLKGERQ